MRGGRVSRVAARNRRRRRRKSRPKGRHGRKIGGIAARRGSRTRSRGQIGRPAKDRVVGLEAAAIGEGPGPFRMNIGRTLRSLVGERRVGGEVLEWLKHDSPGGRRGDGADEPDQGSSSRRFGTPGFGDRRPKQRDERPDWDADDAAGVPRLAPTARRLTMSLWPSTAQRTAPGVWAVSQRRTKHE